MDERKNEKLNNEENNSTNKQEYFKCPTANREYKDCLFRKVFEDKEDLLQLYNAVNGTYYQNVEELEVNTLEDVIYLGIKNDKSFLVAGTMNLYEHQSTYNPNIPIRGLLYFARLYQQYIETRNIRLYGSTLIKLPLPQYIVFYNGTKKEPSKSYLRLSDAFETNGSEAALECVATMFNINYGYNKELLSKCRRLEEYSIFVAVVRRYVKKQKDLNVAINQAVDECIEKDILREFLLKCRSEVIDMVLTSFSQEEYEQTIRDESYQEGIKCGKEQETENGIKKLIVSLKRLEIPQEKIHSEVKKAYNLSDEETTQYIEKYREETKETEND